MKKTKTLVVIMAVIILVGGAWWINKAFHHGQETKTTENGYWGKTWVVDEPAWTDEWDVYETKERAICDTCNSDITDNIELHFASNDGGGSCSGYHYDKCEIFKEHIVDEYEEEGHWEEEWVEE